MKTENKDLKYSIDNLYESIDSKMSQIEDEKRRNFSKGYIFGLDYLGVWTEGLNGSKEANSSRDYDSLGRKLEYSTDSHSPFLLGGIAGMATNFIMLQTPAITLGVTDLANNRLKPDKEVEDYYQNLKNQSTE